MTKEAQQNNPGAIYILNSYAFHCRQLINTLSSYLPVGFEKSKIENLFVEIVNNENHGTFELMLLSESTERIRKRVLISSTFASAYKTKSAIEIYSQLRNCKTRAAQLFKRANTYAIPNQSSAALGSVTNGQN